MSESNNQKLVINSNFLVRDVLGMLLDIQVIISFLVVALIISFCIKMAVEGWAFVTLVVLVYFFLLFLNIILILIYDLIKKNVFGQHVYLITPKELVIRTKIKNTTYRWSEIKYVHKGNYGLFIANTWFSAEFIAWRNFQSNHECEKVFTLIQDCWESSHA